MNFSAKIHQTTRGIFLLALGCIPAYAGTLTSGEITQIETAFGITLSAQEKTDLGAIAKPDSSPTWRTAAEARIDMHRKAALTVRVEDSVGTPVPSAQVAVKLNKNAFKFGGVCTVMDLTDADGNLSADGSTSNDWKNITTNLFNAAGLNNGFKPKIASQHQYIPDFLTWAGNNNLDVRAHLLMWPGVTHLSTASTSAYAHYNVSGAYGTYTNNPTQANMDALKAEADAEIAEWAGRWNVYEWDVINETIGNTLLQEILGYDQMAEWFKIAETNKVGADTGLYINEFKIISAKPTGLDGGTHYAGRKSTYTDRINTVISDGGPITGIGFQSRFKYGPFDMGEAYSRLDEFATLYPALSLAGTEFEMKDGTDYTYTEYERAQMTEELLTTYYSHDQVIGLNAWDFMSATTDISEEKTAALAWYDGTIKLNGLVWYYLHRIRYNTDANDTTDVSGTVSVASAQKGDYDIIVSYNGSDYPASITLSSNQTVTVTLGDVTLIPSANPPVFTVDPINKPNAAENVDYTGQSITNSATDADGDTLTYSKILGPSWLSIAENGDLSGTPSSADVGQNSWIVQASDGFNTNTAVLRITVTGAGSGGPGSNIAINQEADKGWNVTGGSSGTSSYTGISAQQGDVIVLTVTGNKKGSVTPLSCAKVGGTGAVGTQTELTNDLGTYPTSWAWYQTVTATGTFDFDITTDNTAGITALTALYVVRAGSGTIQLADDATWDDTDDASNPASHSLDYTFAAALPDGVVIESASARLDGLATPSGYTQDRVAAAVGTGYKRSLVSYDGVTGSSWSSVYTITDDPAHNTSGAIGMVFVELTSGAGNSPPVFTSDPVVEANALQDVVYAGSTLADHASDGDLDPMSFAKVSGPSWLHVETNGVLSGTPLVGDLGSNHWKISVTDGIATNFATLSISVNVPVPVVSPQDGTNVLFIAIDDINPILGCYGNTLIQTPNIDALAERGMLFENAHCQWSVCGPSRASLMTGLMPEQGGVMGFTKMRGISADGQRDNAKGMTNLVTIPQHFITHGYKTAASGKINDYRCVGSINPDGTINEDGGSVDDPPSWSHGFSSPGGVGGTKAVRTTDSKTVKLAAESVDQPATAFVDGAIATAGLVQLNALATGDTQFFLGVGFKKPHLPFLAPKSSWDLYDDSDFSPASFPDDMLNVTPYTFNNVHELRDNYYLDLSGTNALPITGGILPDNQQRKLQHGYYACISHVDEQVGRLLDQLDTLGLTSNTIVVLWGDHGFHLGDHNEWGKHSNLEQATRVPFIISAPGFPAGEKTTAPAGLLDIYPTLCELAGLPVPEQPLSESVSGGRPLSGRSLVPVLADPVARVQTGIVNHYGSGTYGYAYRTERYRYTEWIDAAGVVQAQELYDYEADPLETVNLAVYPEYEALMYQYSKSMRSATECLGSDRLKSSSAMAKPANLFLPALDGALIGTDVELVWSDAAATTYNVVQKTNLLDAVWSTNQADVVGSPATVPADKQQAFFRIEVSN